MFEQSKESWCKLATVTDLIAAAMSVHLLNVFLNCHRFRGEIIGETTFISLGRGFAAVIQLWFAFAPGSQTSKCLACALLRRILHCNQSRYFFHLWSTKTRGKIFWFQELLKPKESCCLKFVDHSRIWRMMLKQRYCMYCGIADNNTTGCNWPRNLMHMPGADGLLACVDQTQEMEERKTGIVLLTVPLDYWVFRAMSGADELEHATRLYSCQIPGLTDRQGGREMSNLGKEW